MKHTLYILQTTGIEDDQFITKKCIANNNSGNLTRSIIVTKTGLKTKTNIYIYYYTTCTYLNDDYRLS